MSHRTQDLPEALRVQLQADLLEPPGLDLHLALPPGTAASWLEGSRPDPAHVPALARYLDLDPAWCARWLLAPDVAIAAALRAPSIPPTAH